jgi:hypothetical protein
MAAPGSPCSCDESKALRAALDKALSELGRVTDALVDCHRRCAKADREKEELRGRLEALVGAGEKFSEAVARELSRG